MESAAAALARLYAASLLCLPAGLMLAAAARHRGALAWGIARLTGVVLFTAAVFHLCRWLRLSVPLATGIVLLAPPVVVLAVPRCRRFAGELLGNMPWRRVLLGEALFLSMSLAFLAALGPFATAHALGERNFDLALLGSLHRTLHLPPEHIWFAGTQLHYYYFGHLTAALLGRVAALSAAGSYIPLMALVWAMAWAAALMGLRLLRARHDAAWAGAIWALAAGPLMMGTSSRFRAAWASPVTTLMDSTRVIPGTINESPAQAFWVAEFHAHVVAIPAFLLLLGLVARLTRVPGTGGALLVGVWAAALAMTDAWLVPAAAVACALLFANALWWSPAKARPRLLGAGVMATVAAAAMASVLLVGFQGIPLRILQTKWQSSWLHLVAIFGGWALCGLGLAFHLAVARPRLRAASVGAVLLAACLIIAALPEFFYVDNNFARPAERQNTVFRFHFAAFLLFGAGLGAFLGGTARRTRLSDQVARAWALGLGVVLALLLHAPLVWNARSGATGSISPLPALDALRPGTIAAAQYIARHSRPGDVLLESAGHPYNGLAMVSSLSSVPAFTGEEDKLFNTGVPRAAVSARFRAAMDFYQDPAAHADRVRQSGIRWIISSPAEVRAYGKVDSDALEVLFPVVFHSGDVAVHEVDAKVEP